LRRLIQLGIPRGRSLWIGLSLASLEALAAVGLLALSTWLISAAAEQPAILYLNEVIVGVRAFALGRAFFRYTQRLNLHDAIFPMLGALRIRMFEATAPNAPAGLATVFRADTSARMVTDVDAIQGLSLRVITPLLQSVVATVATVLALALLSPTSGAAWVLGATALLAAMVAVPISAAANRANAARVVEGKAHLNAQTAEFLENLDVYRAFGWTTQPLNALAQTDRDLVSSSSNSALSVGLGSSIFSAFATVAVVASSFAGANAVAAGTLDHRWLAVVALVPLGLFEILGSLQQATDSWQRYRASATRVLEALDQTVDPVVAPSTGKVELGKISTIELKGVSLRYPQAENLAVSGVNATLNAGEHIVVEGPSGAGKSTIAFAIAGFLHPVAGLVLINGKPLDDYSEASLRAKIGYLEQNPSIFDANLRQNLLIAKPDATDRQLWNVVKRVGLAETFAAREGMDTQLGERGNRISGGEAQRIALARALLAEFQVLIFDEPTANVDTGNAEELWNDLLAITSDDPNRISIFITHQGEFTAGIEKRISL